MGLADSNPDKRPTATQMHEEWRKLIAARVAVTLAAFAPRTEKRK